MILEEISTCKHFRALRSAPCAGFDVAGKINGQKGACPHTVGTCLEAIGSGKWREMSTAQPAPFYSWVTSCKYISHATFICVFMYCMFIQVL